MIAAIRTASGGASIRVHVVPRAAASGLHGMHGDRLRIRLHAPPSDGQANRELCRFLADRLGVAKGTVVLLQGAGARQKELFVPLPPDEVAARLALA